MHVAALKNHENDLRTAREAVRPSARRGFLVRWFAEVLERGQSLRFLEDVGGL